MLEADDGLAEAVLVLPPLVVGVLPPPLVVDPPPPVVGSGDSIFVSVGVELVGSGDSVSDSVGIVLLADPVADVPVGVGDPLKPCDCTFNSESPRVSSVPGGTHLPYPSKL